MSRNQFNRCIWLIDVLKRRGRLTRNELNELWKSSGLSNNGEDLCRRTLYNYKNTIAEMFDIHIECTPGTHEYYIAENDYHNESYTNWLLNSAAVNDALVASRAISDRILLENVPSAREHLPVVFEALKNKTAIKFNYQNYTRSRPTTGVRLEPYLARFFKQRWYVIGYNVKDKRLKTYALDRMSRVVDLGENFDIAPDFDPQTYFKYSFGIVVNGSEPRNIVIRTDHFNAKYLNALPLHPSQEMSVHDRFCLFRYRMQITDDLVNELLSYGSRIIVEEPRELRVRIREELRKAVEAYDTPSVSILRSSKPVSPVTDPEVLERPTTRARQE